MNQRTPTECLWSAENEVMTQFNGNPLEVLLMTSQELAPLGPHDDIFGMKHTTAHVASQ